MVAIKIEDVKNFTSQLFLKESFDGFLLKEAEIVTFGTVTVDGRLRRGYFLPRELEELGEGAYGPWRLWRPHFFDLIKGKRLPERFRIVLQASKKRTEEFCSRLGFAQENLPVLYLNIRYEDGTLYCITGLSLNFFTLDKTRNGTVRERFCSRKWELRVRDSKGFSSSLEEAVPPLTGGERTDDNGEKGAEGAGGKALSDGCGQGK